MMIINDSALIDQVNPFLDEPSGTWSRPYAFPDKESPVVDEPAQWDSDEQSAGCAASSAGSDNQAAFCHPGTPNCAMRRSLEPMQRVDPDVLYKDDPGNVPVVAVPVVSSDSSFNLIYILVLLLLIAGAVTLIVKF